MTPQSLTQKNWNPLVRCQIEPIGTLLVFCLWSGLIHFCESYAAYGPKQQVLINDRCLQRVTRAANQRTNPAGHTYQLLLSPSPAWSATSSSNTERAWLWELWLVFPAHCQFLSVTFTLPFYHPTCSIIPSLSTLFSLFHFPQWCAHCWVKGRCCFTTANPVQPASIMVWFQERQIGCWSLDIFRQAVARSQGSLLSCITLSKNIWETNLFSMYRTRSMKW